MHACITSHHITLHYMTSHYITLRYVTLHIYIYPPWLSIACPDAFPRVCSRKTPVFRRVSSRCSAMRPKASWFRHGFVTTKPGKWGSPWGDR